MTARALDPTPILALEPIDDETVVPRLVRLPFFCARDGGRKGVELGFALGRHGERRRPDLDPVKVFVEAVEEESEELLRVVLLVAVLEEAARRSGERRQH
jgi:hypothetical protein